jgi:hypothetical protein
LTVVCLNLSTCELLIFNPLPYPTYPPALPELLSSLFVEVTSTISPFEETPAELITGI